MILKFLEISMPQHESLFPESLCLLGGGTFDISSKQLAALISEILLFVNQST
jgi:hypothetical protein